jgi:undecaprenyl-diphosphatase
MSTIEAIILAVIEGITEFLPISSTGHMIIGSSVMGIASDPFTKMFTVAIQFGAILSVIVLYWKKFIPSKNDAKQTARFYSKLFVAFIPAAIIGFLLSSVIDELLERVDVVGYMLVVGGIFFLYVDKIFQKNEGYGERELSYGSALKIGFFQTVAMIPGVSRSAATIIGGLSQRLNKKSAAEFSFFLAVPTMFAATVYKMFKFYKDGGAFGSNEITLLVVGNVVAFIVAILAIKSFISFLTKNGFKVFGYYRILVGIIILVLYYMGVGLTVV